jgi:transcriptional regulator with XRE-family HTH domain
MFSERLIKIRRSLDLTQGEIADKIGKSKAAWQSYEQDKKIPGGDVFRKLYDLGVNINWLLSGDGTMLRVESTPSEQIPQREEVVFAQLDELLGESEVEELMSMTSDHFFEFFNDFSQLNIAQAGWSQMEILRRFPEFRRWLKKKMYRGRETEIFRKKNGLK